MDPSLTLLNTKIPPFRFRHQMGFRDQLSYVLGQHDMPVTETWAGGGICVSTGYGLLGKYLHTKPREERTEKPFLMAGSSCNLIVEWRQLEIKAKLCKSSEKYVKEVQMNARTQVNGHLHFRHC